VNFAERRVGDLRGWMGASWGGDLQARLMYFRGDMLPAYMPQVVLAAEFALDDGAR
jgi:hypothetical protein